MTIPMTIDEIVMTIWWSDKNHPIGPLAQLAHWPIVTGGLGGIPFRMGYTENHIYDHFYGDNHGINNGI